MGIKDKLIDDLNELKKLKEDDLKVSNNLLENLKT